MQTGGGSHFISDAFRLTQTGTKRGGDQAGAGDDGCPKLKIKSIIKTLGISKATLYKYVPMGKADVGKTKNNEPYNFDFLLKITTFIL